jgi:hypothetical protein
VGGLFLRPLRGGGGRTVAASHRLVFFCGRCAAGMASPSQIASQLFSGGGVCVKIVPAILMTYHLIFLSFRRHFSSAVGVCYCFFIFCIVYHYFLLSEKFLTVIVLYGV